MPDTYNTTIEYRRFGSDEESLFHKYLQGEFTGKQVPKMTRLLYKKLIEGISEVFDNAVIHSRTKLGIFACGQVFPRMRRLDFSVVDLGIGIRTNVQNLLGLKLSGIEAILWALDKGNTTRTGNVPGGLGLKLLREFVTLNKGRILIVSDNGYWELDRGKQIVEELFVPFPGTAVNIEFNTADTQSYKLSSEVDSDDIL